MERRSFVVASLLALGFGRFARAPATSADGGFLVPDEFVAELSREYASTVLVPDDLIRDDAAPQLIDLLLRGNHYRRI